MARLARLKPSALPVRYLLVLILLGLSAIAYLDRTNIAVAGIEIAKEFAFDNTRLGWALSAFLIGYAGFQIPAGILADKFGPRLVLTGALVWWSLFTSLVVFIPSKGSLSLLLLVLVRFALGAGESIIYPATSQFVKNWIPIAERGRANGLIFCGIGLGAGLTPPIVIWVIGCYGWRASFWFSAAVGIVAAATWYLLSRDSPEEYFSPIAEAPNKSEHSGGPPLPLISKGRRPPWKEILASKTVFALMASYFAFGYTAWVFFGWFFIYLARGRGLDSQTSAAYSVLPFVGMTAGCLLGGFVSDGLTGRYGVRAGRCVLPCIAMMLTSTLLVCGSKSQNAESACIVLACSAGVLYIAQSCFWTVAVDIAGTFAGVVSAVMNMAAQIGGACATSITPWIGQHSGWESAFIAAAAIVFVGGIIWLLVCPDQILQSANRLN